MEKRSLEADRITYSASMSACERGQEWLPAMQAGRF